MNRNETIKEIKAALRRRSGKPWSVTGGRGTAYGWITIDAPPARRTMKTRLNAGDYEEYDTGQPGDSTTPADRKELGELLGLGGPVHRQGHNIPSSNAYYQEYIDRANGRKPTVIGEPYWD